MPDKVDVFVARERVGRLARVQQRHSFTYGLDATEALSLTMLGNHQIGRLCYSLADKPLPDDNHTPLSLNELLNSDIEESCATSSPSLGQLINTHTGFTPIGEAIGNLLQQRIL